MRWPGAIVPVVYVHGRTFAVMLALTMSFPLVGAQALGPAAMAGVQADAVAEGVAGFQEIAAAFPEQTPEAFPALVEHTLRDGQIRAVLALRDRAPDTEEFVAHHTGPLVFLGTTPHAIALVSAAGAQELLSSGVVTYLEPDQPLTHLLSESAVETNARSISGAGGVWRYDGGQLVSAHPAFSQPVTGRGVTVSIVDSGIDRTHRDFGGWDCTWQPYEPCDSRIRFAGKTQTLPRAFLGGSLPDDLTTTLTDLYPEDVAPTTEVASGHGTHVAGTIGGNARYTRDGGADPARYGSDGHNFGMAPEVDLVSISNGDSQWAGLGTAALAWTLDNAMDMDIRVSSNSWGCLGGCAYNPASSTSQLVRDLYEAGVVVTFAVGNDGGGANGVAFSGYAQSPYVLGVANYDHHTGSLAAGSSRGAANNDDLPDPAGWDPDDEAATAPQGGHRRPDVAAPGTSIWSARTLTGGTSSLVPRITTEDAIGGGTNGFVPYVTMGGTSMATPHVSGAAALLFDACPGASALDVMRAVMAGADASRVNGDLAGYQRGYGALDVRASLDWMLASTDCAGGAADADGDGVLDSDDNCPASANPDQTDVDGDGIGDACDDDPDDGPLGDGDGDGVPNKEDAFPDDPSEWEDSDGDGVGDNSDACPGHDDSTDGDGDGTPDGCDDDRDGVSIASPDDGSGHDVGSSLEVAGRFVASSGDPCVDCNGDGFVVIAIPDTGINPYHDDFSATLYPRNGDTDRDNDVGFDAHPSTYLDGFPASARPLDLTIDGSDNRAKDGGAFAAVQMNQLYWIPGTKIIGAVDTSNVAPVNAAADNVHILDEDGHGTGSASVAAGNLHGSCPQCLLVVVEGLSGDTWAFEQDWIDIVSTSGGTLANAGAPTTPVVTNSYKQAQRSAAERGQSLMYAAGNGCLSYICPEQTYTSDSLGPDWTLNIGALTVYDDGTTQSIVMSGKPVQLSSYSSASAAAPYRIESACHTGASSQCNHSGTSAATPITAGHFGAVLAKARSMLGSGSVGQERSGAAGVVAQGQSIPGHPYLDDGRLTRAELWDVMFHAAGDLGGSGWVGFPVTVGTFPTEAVQPAATGYGVADDGMQARALAVMGGDVSKRLDKSDAERFMAVDREVRTGLWGGWDDDRDTVPFSSSGSSLDALGWTPEQAAADVDGFLDAYSEADDGILPGLLGEVRDVRTGSDGSHLEFELVVGELDDLVPTVLGNPVTYQVKFTAGHNVASGIEYVASYRNELAETQGNLPTGGTFSQTFEVYATTQRQGNLASLCPTPIDTTGSRTVYDEDANEYRIQWRIPFDGLLEDNLPGHQECDDFTRNGRALQGGDTITGIQGTATLKLGIVTFGDFEDSAEGGSHVVPGGEGPACPEPHLLLSIGNVTHCQAIDASRDSDWNATLDTGALAAGTYTLVAEVIDGGVVSKDSIEVTFSEPDRDGDGVPDGHDNCPDDPNAGQGDLDGDGIGDACDPRDNRDSDGDGVEDWEDAFPDDASEWSDRDGDGVGDNSDAFPDDPDEWADSDGDGVGDNGDACPGSGDGHDHDRDGVPDGCDPDADDGDGDGIHSQQDDCPGHADPGQEDMDGDGRGDACDPDRDGDGHPNGKEVARGSDPDDPDSVP